MVVSFSSFLFGWLGRVEILAADDRRAETDKIQYLTRYLCRYNSGKLAEYYSRILKK